MTIPQSQFEGLTEENRELRKELTVSRSMATIAFMAFALFGAFVGSATTLVVLSALGKIRP